MCRKPGSAVRRVEKSTRLQNGNKPLQFSNPALWRLAISPRCLRYQPTLRVLKCSQNSGSTIPNVSCEDLARQAWRDQSLDRSLMKIRKTILSLLCVSFTNEKAICVTVTQIAFSFTNHLVSQLVSVIARDYLTRRSVPTLAYCGNWVRVFEYFANRHPWVRVQLQIATIAIHHPRDDGPVGSSCK